jgi:hexokinase
MWRSPGDGSDDGKGQHTWKISPVDATVEDQVQQDERSVLVSDIAGTNFAIQVVAGTPTIRGH